jgi:nitrogen-specific signal transduction histidine kinase/CheY-like chemotaxis protein
MELLDTLFRDVMEKHTDNTQIQRLLAELKEDLIKILHTQPPQVSCPETQTLKNYAHHCLRPEVINNLSHKVKTPLTAIISGIQLLYNYDHDECVLRIMDYLMQSSIELTQFVNDIMDMYYITQDKFDIEYESVNIAKLIEYVYSVYALQMQEENINFHYEIDKQIPVTIITDKKRLTQILINLFSNAIKSFDYDQANKQIHLTFKQLTATRLQLHILDSGKGIDLQNAETLFNPFYKTENSEGIGLGLTICRLLLKKIGSGTIKFITPSKPEFSTELVAEFDIKQEPKHIVRPSIISRNIRDPILVLIDDNTTNLDLLKIIITNITDKNGYKVTIKTFNDPTAAKSFMLAHMNQIILCLLDMKMPKLTGVDLIRAIYDNNNDNINNNNNNTDKPIPFSFIIVSALPRTYITESIAQLPVQVQPNIVISSKPYNMQDIEKHIITVLKTKLFRITVV